MGKLKFLLDFRFQPSLKRDHIMFLIPEHDFLERNPELYGLQRTSFDSPLDKPPIRLSNRHQGPSNLDVRACITGKQYPDVLNRFWEVR